MDKKGMTRSEFESLREELSKLIAVERPLIAQKLKEARSNGDLSENAEYDEARREQRDLETRIQELQYTIEHALYDRQ